MCEGGRVLHHLRSTIGDSRNTVVIVGFQAQHTLGRRLVEAPPRGPHLRRDADAAGRGGGAGRLLARTPTRRACSTSPRPSAIEVRCARCCSFTVSRPPSRRWRVASPRAAFRRCTRRRRGSACGCEAPVVAHGARGRRRPPPGRRGRRAPRRAHARGESRSSTGGPSPSWRASRGGHRSSTGAALPWNNAAELESMTRARGQPLDVTVQPMTRFRLHDPALIQEVIAFPSAVRLDHPESNVARAYVYRRGRLGERPIVVWVPGQYALDAWLAPISGLTEEIVRRGVDVVLLVPPYHLERTPAGFSSGDAVLAASTPDHLRVFAQELSDLRRLLAWLRGLGRAGAGWTGHLAGRCAAASHRHLGRRPRLSHRHHSRDRARRHLWTTPAGGSVSPPVGGRGPFAGGCREALRQPRSDGHAAAPVRVPHLGPVRALRPHRRGAAHPRLDGRLGRHATCTLIRAATRWRCSRRRCTGTTRALSTRTCTPSAADRGSARAQRLRVGCAQAATLRRFPRGEARLRGRRRWHVVRTIARS